MLDFEFLEHTADIAVRVYAESLKKLFVNTSVAMFQIITDYKPALEKEQEIFLEANSWEELLGYWLNELLSLFYSYNFLPSQYNIELIEKSNYSLKGKITGEDCRQKQLDIKTEIKAATYYNVNIEKDEKGFRVEIVFDV